MLEKLLQPGMINPGEEVARGEALLASGLMYIRGGVGVGLRGCWFCTRAIQQHALVATYFMILEMCVGDGDDDEEEEALGVGSTRFQRP